MISFFFSKNVIRRIFQAKFVGFPLISVLRFYHFLLPNKKLIFSFKSEFYNRYHKLLHSVLKIQNEEQDCPVYMSSSNSTCSPTEMLEISQDAYIENRLINCYGFILFVVSDFFSLFFHFPLISFFFNVFFFFEKRKCTFQESEMMNIQKNGCEWTFAGANFTVCFVCFVFKYCFKV